MEIFQRFEIDKQFIENFGLNEHIMEGFFNYFIMIQEHFLFIQILK